MTIDFLFLSNGYGEDSIAARIAEQVAKRFAVAAFPLIGEGKGYARRGIHVVRSFPALPGAGVSLSRDVRGGLLPLLMKQWGALRELSPAVSRAVAVGDIFPCFLSHFALMRPYVFVGTAKSVYVQPYNFFERWLMKKAERVYVRDAPTADHLLRRGVRAFFEGNPMMDDVAESEISLPPFNGPTIALLPGSRSDAPANFLIQAEALSALQARMGVKLRGIAILPPTLDPSLFLTKLSGWDGTTLGGVDGILAQYEQGEVSILFVSAGLGDVLRVSTLVLGQAGTANEQAAGLGKPVVAFDFDLSRNGKLSWYRWRQKKLLGKALTIPLGSAVELARLNAERIGEKAGEILKNRALYDEMSREGAERIGQGGAAKPIADYLSSLVQNKVP